MVPGIDAVPADVTNVILFDVVLGDRRGRTPKTIKMGMLPSAAPC